MPVPVTRIPRSNPRNFPSTNMSATTFAATGRRKTATARVTITAGTGQWKINDRALDHYFPILTLRSVVNQPLAAAQQEGKFNITVRVTGSGPNGQAGAIRHGLARALLAFDANLRPALRKGGLLTRDPRERESKKPGQPGARKRFQFAKR